MEISNHKCDICGKIDTVEDYCGPLGWWSVSRNTEDRKKDFWGRSRDVCNECGRGIEGLFPVQQAH